jgi:hypothetical protein
METFDYLVGLVSIVIGLGLAEVASRTNLLLRSVGARHDPLVFGPPILVAIMLVAAWFDVWAVRRIPNLFSFPFFVAIFAQLMVLYLLAAACVPVTNGSSARLTAESYERNRPYFWRLFTVYELMYVGFWVFFQTKKGWSPAGLMQRAFTPSGSALPLVVGIGMLLTRNRLAHAVGLILLVLWLFAGYWSSSIG